MSATEMLVAPAGRVWHVVNCKPRQEAIAATNLQRQGFEVYLPRLRTRQRRAGCWVDDSQALFPRYLFVHVDPRNENTAPIRSTRGAVGLVRFGGRAAVLADEVVAAIRARAEAETGLHEDPRYRLVAGDRVSVTEGPLAGMEGLFAGRDGEARSFILLELLGKMHRVGVSRDWIEKAA